MPPSRAIDRLSYPLTYWNALGVFVAIGAVLAVHLACELHEHLAVRVVAEHGAGNEGTGGVREGGHELLHRPDGSMVRGICGAHRTGGAGSP